MKEKLIRYGIYYGSQMHQIGANCVKKLAFAVGRRPRRLLFGYVPKSPGTSVILFLAAQYPKSRTFGLRGMALEESHREFEEMGDDRRMDLWFVHGHGAHKLTPRLHHEMVKATLLRNAVDRTCKILLDDYHVVGVLEDIDHWMKRRCAEVGLATPEVIVRKNKTAERPPLGGDNKWGTGRDIRSKQAGYRCPFEGERSIGDASVARLADCNDYAYCCRRIIFRCPGLDSRRLLRDTK